MSVDVDIVCTHAHKHTLNGNWSRDRLDVLLLNGEKQNSPPKKAVLGWFCFPLNTFLIILEYFFKNTNAVGVI